MSSARYNTCPKCGARIDRGLGYVTARFPNYRNPELLDPARFYCLKPECAPLGATWVKRYEARPKAVR
jgi:hypothetical protein